MISNNDDRKEIVSQNAALLHLLFRKLSADEITTSELIDNLERVGLRENSDLKGFLRKRDTSSFKFRDFLAALGSDTDRISYTHSATPTATFGSSQMNDVFGGGAQDASDYAYLNAHKKSTRSGGGGVSDAMRFDGHSGNMYETSSGSYGKSNASHTPLYSDERYISARDDMEDSTHSTPLADKTSAYSRESKRLSCPWGTEEDGSFQSTPSKHKAQPASGAWFNSYEASPAKTRGASNNYRSAPIWGTDLDM